MSTAVDPNLNPVIVAGAGGGGASLPATPAAALLDVASPSTFVVLDPAGVGTSISAADARAALGARVAVPDTGWTDVIAGTASVTHTGGVQTLNVNSGGGVLSHRASLASPECPALELIGRLDVTTGTPGTAWWSGLSLGSAADNYGYIAQVADAGAVQLWQAHSSGYSLVGSAGSVSLTSGDTYIRLVVTPSYAAASYGTGSGSTAPTSWTVAASVAITTATLAASRLDRVGLRAGRTASGSGTYTAEWRNVQARILGLSP